MLKILMFILIFFKIATSEEFVVVSTTQTPSHQQISALEKGLAEIDRKLTKLDEKVDTVENHIKTVDERYNEDHSKLPSVDQMSALEKELAEINRNLIRLDQKVETVESHMKTIDEKYNDDHYKLQSIDRTFVPKNCKEAQNAGNTVSGIYRIHPHLASDSFLVLCDMKTKGGGWTYVLNRFDGSQNFFLNWMDYRQGFGNLTGEFWLGLENLYSLTGYEPTELLFEFMDWDFKKASARYGTFAIGSEKEGYNIKLIHGYSGDAGDSFSQHAGMKFTTSDKDQDNDTNGNCASFYKSAWWYNSCSSSDLCGSYQKGKVNDTKESIMYWGRFKGNAYSLKQARMMVKPRDNKSSHLLPHEVSP